MSFHVNVRGGKRTERLSAEQPLTGHDIITRLRGEKAARSTMAWRVDRTLRPLVWPVDRDIDAEFIDTASLEGTDIYRNTLAFILSIASRRAIGCDVSVRYSMSDSYYCELIGRKADADAVDSIGAEMRRMTSSEIPIRLAPMSLDSACRALSEQGDSDGADLLHWKGDDHVALSVCDGRRTAGDESLRVTAHAYFTTPLAPYTSSVDVWSLDLYEGGMLLRFPSVTGGGIQPFEISGQLMSVFTDYAHWLDVLGLRTMADLHAEVAAGRALDVILVCEALHDMAFSDLACKISDKDRNIRLVCIAGPSSSAKTTTSKRLSIQLRVLGRNPVPLELDNYYVDREDTPRDEDGKYDFEALDALDIDMINDHISRLLAGEEVDVPRYDFIIGKRVPGRKLKLEHGDVLIIEGIHGLNDVLTRSVPRDQCFKVFASPLTGVNLTSLSRIGTTDTRLIRRLVRDCRTRGHSPLHTLRMWPSVVRGSHKYIFPYEAEADVLFNTSLAYEMSVLKLYAAPMLRSVPPDADVYGEARRILSLLSFVPTIPADDVPNTSILREFIGGGCFGA